MSTFSFRDLTKKEVICTCDGARLGFFNDFEADAETGRITAYLLPDTRFFSFSCKSKFRVRREWITKVGKDIILVCRYETVK